MRMGPPLRLVHAMPNMSDNLTEAAALFRAAWRGGDAPTPLWTAAKMHATSAN